MNSFSVQSQTNNNTDINNALFHYTSAQGLIGIFETRSLWGTAHYCTNDETEMLAVSKEVAKILEKWNVEFFANNPELKARWEEKQSINYFIGEFIRLMSNISNEFLISYITSFCSANEKSFKDGLLSQWRGYGVDGGYAIQFNKKQLLDVVDSWNTQHELNYHLAEISYSINNSFKDQFLKDEMKFKKEFYTLIETILNNSDLTEIDYLRFLEIIDPLIYYQTFTKNEHFDEEKEWRLRLVKPVAKVYPFEPVKRYSRNGLIVSYISTPTKNLINEIQNGKNHLDVIDCIDRIIIGPSPRMDARLQAVESLIRHMHKSENSRKIQVDKSEIPFTRF